MSFALVRVETRLEVKALVTDVADEGLVPLLLAVLVVLLHVGRKGQD